LHAILFVRFFLKHFFLFVILASFLFTPMKQTFSSIYLVLYNTISILILLYSTANAILFQLTYSSTYILKCALSQTFFLFEILNIVLRMSRSTIFPTIVQLFSRLYIIWVIVYLHDIKNVYLTSLLIVWNLSDLIRYFFYLFRWGVFRRLRYNAFLLLYPIGIFLEIYLTNIVYLKYQNWLSWVFGGSILMYLPLFPYLYYHMIKQRRRSNKIFDMKRRKNV
jgi:very-long-chain (3R)-3-hydroxyacyl-CoA dehydratase